MNKTILAILLALTPAALYIIFALFNPLPPLSTQYVATVNGVVEGIVSPFKGFVSNPTLITTAVAAACSTSAGLVVNYVKSKSKEVALGQAAQVTQQVESENKGLYETLGQIEQKNIQLTEQTAKIPKLEEAVKDQEQTIRQLEERNQQLIWQKASLNKQDKDEIKKDVLADLRKP